MSVRWIAVLAAAVILVAGGHRAAGQSAEAKESANPPAATVAAPNTATRGSTGAPVDDKEYVIGPEDVLGIEVWSDARLTGTVMVRPDGKISLSLVGELEAAGKTALELQADIAERLKAGDIIKAPLVKVEVRQINSKKYYLQGEVKSPGSYPLITPTTVLEALVKAGGFQDFANKKKIRILRMEKGKVTEFKFNYNDVTRGRKVEQNINLKPGDQIIVP